MSSVQQTVLAQLFTCDFLIYKKDTRKPQTFLPIPPKHPHDPSSYYKIITFVITLKKYTYKSENTLTTPFNTKKIITFIITLQSISEKLTHFYTSPKHTHNPLSY